MASPSANDVAFVLERFGWSSPERLEVVGRWSGVEDHRLGSLILVVRANGRTHRLSGMAELPSGGQGSWRASFAWKGQPLTVDEAKLEVGRDLVVPLPAPRPQGGRFARTAVPDADHAPSTHADEEEPSVAEGREQPTQPSTSAAAVDPNDPLALQEALIDAREEAELAKEALEEARDCLLYTSPSPRDS